MYWGQTVGHTAHFSMSRCFSLTHSLVLMGSVSHTIPLYKKESINLKGKHSTASRNARSLSTILVGCLLACFTSQQHATVSQGRICSHNFTCCHTEIEVADPTSHPVTVY